MTNAKSTKRALLASVMALLLCFSMLLGTTFAWFTDAVTSGSNVIQTGNLDIEVEYTLDGENWADLDGAANLFKKGSWEPGHTEVVALRITNIGSLALKYTANMKLIEETVGKTADGKDIVLSDILTVSTLTQQANDDMGVGAIALGLAFKGENSVAYQNTTTFKAGNVLGNNVELHPGDAHYLIVKVDMPETVGNEANHDGEHIPTINFGINVFATQYTSEKDSFGNQYDKDAPVVTVVDKPYVSNYTATEPYTVNGGGQTIVGKASSADVFTWIENRIPEMSNIFSSANGSMVTVNDLTFTGTMSSVMAGNYVNANYNKFNTEFNNVNIVDAKVVSFTADVAPALTVYGTAVLNNCQITGTVRSELDTEDSPVYDMAVVNYSTTTLNNTKVGTIFVWNHAKLIVAEGSEVGTIVVKGNMNTTKYGITVEEGATVGVIDLSAIEDVNKVNITIEDGATFGGFVDDNFKGVTFATLDAWKAAEDKTADTVSTAEALKTAIAEGKNVVLTADITVDANTAITVDSGKNVTLYLNGHTISATADKTGSQELFLVKGNMTVKNGSLELTAKNNQDWNAMATIFDVTAGGVLNMDGVTASVSGTDMNFIVHLNNWGTATLNVNNCDFTTTYCAVRVFNDGPDMNNVTIENSNFVGGRMLWVHNYTSEGKGDSTLTLDIYGNDNTSDNAAPVRFGFSDSVYYDLDGNEIA